MAISWVGRNIVCLQSDVATLPATAPTNTEAWVTDSSRILIYNGTAWLPKSRRSFGIQVWRLGVSPYTFYVQDSEGVVLGSGAGGSAALITAIQAGLDKRGEIIFHGVEGSSTLGEYDLTSGSFTGFNISSDTYIRMMPNAFFTVAQGYTGAVFKVLSPSEAAHKKGITFDGCRFFEGGATPASNWDAILFEASDDVYPGGGIFQNIVRNCYARRCNNFVHMKVSGSKGWINSNRFENNWVDYPRVGFLWDTVITAYLSYGMHYNRFLNNTIQDDSGGPILDAGFKDISGVSNSLQGNEVWDLTNPGARGCNLTANATNTVIVGGDVTRVPADWAMTQDKGVNTVVLGGESLGGYHNLGPMNPFMKKCGVFMGTGNAASAAIGDGLLNAIAIAGGSATVAVDANGWAKQINTTTTSGTRSGLRMPTTCTTRGFNFFLKIRCKLNQLTDCRTFVGAASAEPTLTAEDPINAVLGIGVGFSSTSPVSAVNWLAFHNDNLGATVVTDTGIAADTNPHTFYFAAVDAAPAKVGYRIDNNDAVFYTTEIPGQYSGLAPGLWICNSQAFAKTMDTYAMYLEQDPR